MKRIKDRIELWLNAITFAETGDYDSARQFLKQASGDGMKDSSVDRGEVECTQIDEGIVAEVERHLVATGVMKHGDLKEALAALGLGKKPKAVLLAARGDTLYASSLCYAVSLCKRLDAHLEILQTIEDPCEPPPSGNRAYKPAGSGQTELSIHRLSDSRLPFQVTMRTGEFTHVVNEYLKGHKHVAVVVYDSPAARNDQKEWKRMQRLVDELSHQLSIPLVTVAPR